MFLLSGPACGDCSELVFCCRVSLSREVRTSLIMADNKRLAFSIIQFLHDQLGSGNLSSGAQESLEGESSEKT